MSKGMGETLQARSGGEEGQAGGDVVLLLLLPPAGFNLRNSQIMRASFRERRIFPRAAPNHVSGRKSVSVSAQPHSPPSSKIMCCTFSLCHT